MVDELKSETGAEELMVDVIEIASTLAGIEEDADELLSRV